MNQHDEQKVTGRSKVVPPSQIRYEAKIRCSGKLHKVSVVGYSLVMHGHLDNITACEVAASLGGEEGTCTCLKVREAFKRAIRDGEVKTKSGGYANGYADKKILKGLKDADKKLLPKQLREAVMALVEAVDVKRRNRRERGNGKTVDVLAPTGENRKIRDANMSRDRCLAALKASNHKFGRGLAVAVGGYNAPTIGQNHKGTYTAEVKHDWIRTVAIRGLATVDSHVVLGVLETFADGTLRVLATHDRLDEKTKAVTVEGVSALARKCEGKWSLVFPAPKEGAE